MLVLYLLLLGALALFTAYTRNFQRTLVALEGEVEAGAGMAWPHPRFGASTVGSPPPGSACMRFFTLVSVISCSLPLPAA